MKVFSKLALTVVSITTFALSGFAAEVKAPAQLAESAAKVDAKTVTAKDKAIGKAADTKSAARKLVDINSATDAELKGVPGIGEAYAAKIIAGRPYANKAQLKSRKVVPSSVYEQIKELLIAKQAKK